MILAGLVLFMLFMWLVPTSIEWHATQLKVCVDHEMTDRTYDATSVKDTEQAIGTLLDGPCAQYYEAYVSALIQAEQHHYKEILSDSSAMETVRNRFKKIAVIYLATFYLS